MFFSFQKFKMFSFTQKSQKLHIPTLHLCTLAPNELQCPNVHPLDSSFRHKNRKVFPLQQMNVRTNLARHSPAHHVILLSEARTSNRCNNKENTLLSWGSGGTSVVVLCPLWLWRSSVLSPDDVIRVISVWTLI